MTSGASRGQVFTPNRRPMKKRMAPGTSREAPEDPEGPQKSIRNCLFAKKRALQTWIFVDFFAQGCFLRFGRVFSSIFDEKSMKNQRKKQCIFSVQCLFFWAWRPSRNIVFYNAKATFPFFVFLCFFYKKRQKMTPKCKEQFCITKSPKNDPRGPVFGDFVMQNCSLHFGVMFRR